MKKQIVEELALEIDETMEDQPIITYDITSYPSDFTLNGIVDMWKAGDISIPEFQREYVWNIKQASLLIESFLLGLPVPPVFFYIDEKNKNLVIDGQQRIISTVFYFEGYFGFENTQGKRKVFRLQGLNEKSPFYNKKFSELSENDQRKLRNSVLRAINIRQITPASDYSSVYHIFERLNTGGTPLTSQEIRNVVYRGQIVSELRQLNENKDWRSIMGLRRIDKYQHDVELILRIFGLSNYLEEYEKPMKDFLNKIMDRNRDAKTSAFKKFVESFPDICSIIVKNFGEKPFHLRGPLNTSILDSVFCTLLMNPTKIPQDIHDRYKRLRDNKELEVLTTRGTTDTQTVKNRFKLIRSLLMT